MAQPDNNSSRWRLGLSANVLLLGAVSFFNDAASEMIYPLLPLFLTVTLGAGPTALGVIEGVAESTASFLKLASGYLSDRVHHRKRWVVVGYLLANLTRPLIGLASSWFGVLLLRFVDRVGKGLRTSPRDALIAESTPQTSWGKAFGFHRAADHAGAVAGPLLATLALTALPGQYGAIFLLSLIPGLLALGLLVAGVRDLPTAAAPTRREPLHIAAAWREMPSTLRRFTLILLLFTLGNSSDVFLLLKAQQLGVPIALIPLLWMALHLVKMGSSLPAGILSDRLGRKGMIVAGWGVYVLTYCGFALADAAWQAWGLFLVYGLYFGLTEGVEKALIADLAPERLRGSAFGLYHLAIGIGALPASLLFGWVWQRFGDPAAFGMGAVIALAAMLWLWPLRTH
ncbi:MAG: MFS transporter [Nitrospirae bacterium]|nr:MFS transporter [Nitrospirota bacterium]